jgi:hypothetical protein
MHAMNNIEVLLTYSLILMQALSVTLCHWLLGSSHEGAVILLVTKHGCM